MNKAGMAGLVVNFKKLIPLIRCRMIRKKSMKDIRDEEIKVVNEKITLTLETEWVRNQMKTKQVILTEDRWSRTLLSVMGNKYLGKGVGKVGGGKEKIGSGRRKVEKMSRMMT